MRVRASHLVLVLLVLGTVFALVPTQALRGDETSLLMVVWGMPFEDQLFRDGYARDFETAHPGVEVRYARYPDVIAKYEAWHTVGRGADIMRMPIPNYPDMVAKGMLADLTPFMDDPNIGLSEAERADFFPWVWGALDVDGRRYALPSDNSQYGVHYNRALFDAYNAAHPDDPLGYPDATWTWADLRRARRLLERRNAAGRVEQYAVSFDLWAWPFLAFYKQAGGVVWDADQTTTLVNGPAGVEALSLIVELIPEDAPVRSAQMSDTASGPDDLFKLGKLAILLDGSWRVPNIELESPGLDFAVAPLPHHREHATTTGCVLWAVSAHSEHKRLAWQMVRWLVSREQSLRYWDTLRVAPPAQISIVRSDEFRSTGGIVEGSGADARVIVPPMPKERFAERAAWLLAALEPAPGSDRYPGFLLVSPYQADLEGKLVRALVQAVRGEKSPAEALDEAVADTHAIIDRDRAAKGLSPVQRQR
jgi:multiple sugar transport system substrate-binding protein